MLTFTVALFDSGTGNPKNERREGLLEEPRSR